MIHPTFAILHHTADISKGPQLKKVDEYHKLRFGMYSSLGFWVGYHWFIEQDGTVIQTRANYEEGAHTKGHNSEAIGICFAGNFDYEAPSKAQLDALAALTDRLALYFQVPTFPLKYHFNFSDTHCPGGYFIGNEWRKFIINNQLTFLGRILLWLQKLKQT